MAATCFVNALYASIIVVGALLRFQVVFADVGDITISEVAIKNLFDNRLVGVQVGNQFVLTAILTNNGTQPLSYAAFLELRDNNGVTRYLEFHKGRLDPSASSNIASSWTPKTIGEYEMRVFAINDFENPEILSTIGTATTTIRWLSIPIFFSVMYL